jgi:hypothetical protein
MAWETWLVVVVAVVLLLGWVVWVDASRLDRLHRRVNASRAVLDTQLVRRASVAVELGTSGLLDPVTSVIVTGAAVSALEAGGEPEPGTALPPELSAELSAPPRPSSSVRRAEVAGPVNRGQVESELTAALRQVLDDPADVAALRAEPPGDELVEELASAWYRLQLARRFHNNAVAHTRAARRRPLVRVLRLAGSAPEPTTAELDDEWPAGLEPPGHGGTAEPSAR